MIKNFNSLYSALNEVMAAKRQFERLNIIISNNAEISFNYADYIHEEVAKIQRDDVWNTGLSFTKKLALALACTEEDRNNHIDDSEIELVNKFFDVRISRELISEMHGQFV